MAEQAQQQMLALLAAQAGLIQNPFHPLLFPQLYPSSSQADMLLWTAMAQQLQNANQTDNQQQQLLQQLQLQQQPSQPQESFEEMLRKMATPAAVTMSQTTGTNRFLLQFSFVCLTAVVDARSFHINLVKFFILENYFLGIA